MIWFGKVKSLEDSLLLIFGGIQLILFDSVKNLGDTLDLSLLLEKQIKAGVFIVCFKDILSTSLSWEDGLLCGLR